jgi:hypothetical protein
MNGHFRFLADEDFDRRIVDGVFPRIPNTDFLRAQEAGLTGWLDPALLEWAAANGRVVVSHDVTTMQGAAAERIAEGLPCRACS